MIDEYKKIECVLENQFAKYIPEVILITKKWNNNDYVYPFSDIDYRLVVEDGTDLFRLNEQLYEVHYKCASEIRYGTRILEHPPGFIYYQNELKNLSINRDIFCRDSYLSGDKRLFDDTYFRIDTSLVDSFQVYEAFKQRVNNFSLKYEYKSYDSELMQFYEKYCVIWHYYLPCIYFLNVLKDRRTYNQKINECWYSEPFLTLIDDFRNKKEPSRDMKGLIKLVDDELNIIMKNKLYFKLNYEKKDNNDVLFMLRTRMARILYYLNPPSACNTLYLQERECKELKKIFFSFYINEKNDIWKSLLNVLESNSLSTTNKLQAILKYLYSERSYMSEIILGGSPELSAY